MASPLNNLVLVLNACFEPCNVVTVKRALTLVLGGKAVVESPGKETVQTAHATFPVPSVIRLIVYRRIPRMTRSVSRKNILLRDRFTCQYCGAVFVTSKLTLDHVVPRSKGGGNSWENLVTSCKPCNALKADRTPQEAGMRLLHKPAAIGIHAKHRLVMEQNGGKGLEGWDRYLFC